MSTLYINGQCLERSITGVERYTLAVLSALDDIARDECYHWLDIHLLLPPKGRCELPFHKIRMSHVGRWHGHLWEQVELPFFCKDGVLLSLHSVAPLFKRHQLVVMHDAKVAHKGKSDIGNLKRICYSFLGKTLGRVLPRIIAISNFAAKDIHKGFDIPYEKIVVILSGRYSLEEVHSEDGILDRLQLQRKKYILAVGGGSTKNNVLTANAVEMMGREDLYFVVAGFSPEVMLQQLNQFTRTKCIGRVTDEELTALYKNALCLAFPSLVEGFGVPPLEAMSVGCPVIASTCEAVPEICGDAALYVDAYSVDDMKQKIEMLENNQDLMEDLVLKGYKNLDRFDWYRTAKSILDNAIELMNKK